MGVAQHNPQLDSGWVLSDATGHQQTLVDQINMSAMARVWSSIHGLGLVEGMGNMGRKKKKLLVDLKTANKLSTMNTNGDKKHTANSNHNNSTVHRNTRFTEHLYS